MVVLLLFTQTIDRRDEILIGKVGHDDYNRGLFNGGLIEVGFSVELPLIELIIKMQICLNGLK